MLCLSIGMKTVMGLWTRGQTVKSIPKTSNGAVAKKTEPQMVVCNASIPLATRRDVCVNASVSLTKEISHLAPVLTFGRVACQSTEPRFL